MTTHFEPGCITGLIGPSGAGKTTLIKCILGMEAIDSGNITIEDVDIPNRKIYVQLDIWRKVMHYT